MLVYKMLLKSNVRVDFQSSQFDGEGGGKIQVCTFFCQLFW